MSVMRVFRMLCVLVAVLVTSASALAQGDKKPDEAALGVLPITGNAAGQQPLPKIGILPSLSPDLEDVLVRSVVRRDFQLTGMYDVIADAKAPAGTYGWDDPVEVDAWQKLGAEAVVKVKARKQDGTKVQVLGLAYFMNVGKDPVYKKSLVVDASELRVTAHRMTDALLGALTGRPGGFASHFVYAAKWGRNHRIFRMDSDGHDLTPVTDAKVTSIAPAWGPNQSIFFAVSKNFAPFKLASLVGTTTSEIKLSFKTTIYSVALNKDHTKMALAVGEPKGSSIWVGNPDGTGMKKVSTTQLSTHPAFSPSGKLAWVGGTAKAGSQRVYLDNKPISPPGFTAAAPVFCDTEDGVRVVYSVAVGNDKHDIVMSNEKGQGMTRLTQGQGSNHSPACSPDGRMIAFFSTRGKKPGTFFMSLKRWRTNRLNNQIGESLRWEALPPPAASAQP
jgi:TolB protein